MGIQIIYYRYWYYIVVQVVVLDHLAHRRLGEPLVLLQESHSGSSSVGPKLVYAYRYMYNRRREADAWLGRQTHMAISC